MLLKRTSAAAAPLTDLMARDHLRVTSTDEIDLIGHMLAAATAAISERVGRSLGPETWEMSIASASGDIDLPKPPVQTISSIAYYDANDVLQTLQTSDFYLFTDDDKAILRPKPGKAWPYTTSSREDAIKITFVAGYAALPEALRAAILLMTAHLFENREVVVIGASVAELPMSVESLVSLYRRGWIAA